MRKTGRYHTVPRVRIDDGSKREAPWSVFQRVQKSRPVGSQLAGRQSKIDLKLKDFLTGRNIRFRTAVVDRRVKLDEWTVRKQPQRALPAVLVFDLDPPALPQDWVGNRSSFGRFNFMSEPALPDEYFA